MGIRHSIEQVERSIVAAREGSLTALGQLLDHYRDYLLRVANDELARGLAPKLGGSDLVQETFLRAAKDFRRFAGLSEGELRAWLRQILICTIHDANRSYHGTQKRAVGREISLAEVGFHAEHAELVCPSPTASVKLQAADNQLLLRAAIERLPEEYRKAVELRTFEHKSFEEIGAALGRSGEAARKLWTRGIETLAIDLTNAR